METHMKDKIAEGLMLFSAFATIVVMLLIIIKESSKQRKIDTKEKKSHVKKKPHYESETLHLD